MKKLVGFDWAIKDLLRNKANFDILEGFLSELLQTDIEIESLLESEGGQANKIDKFNHIDLLVQSIKKERIIIEIQCSTQWDYLSRILHATSKIKRGSKEDSKGDSITEHLKKGVFYKNISKVISVSIVFFNLGEGKDYLYQGKTNFTGLHFKDELKLGVEEMKIYGQEKNPADIFPEYYIIKVNQFNERIQSKFDEWVYFLKNEQIKPTFNAKGIQLAAEKLDVLRLDEKKRKEYEHYQEGLHYDASMALPYEIGKEEGRKEGKEEGRKEGREEGLLEGREEGLAEGAKQAQLQISKALKQAGLSLPEILKMTGLTVKDFEEIN